MATLALQARQARASGEILNYATLTPKSRPIGELLAESQVLCPVVWSLTGNSEK